MQLTFNSQSRRKGTAGLGYFQIFRPDLRGVVATDRLEATKGAQRAKSCRMSK